MASVDYEFDWEFLVYLIICGILTLFFLLYFNRLFASLISYGIRTWTWHKYRVHLDIQAIQISLLAGRVFFKGIKYHGNNETILVHSGYATWCYWLRNVREVDIRKGKGDAKRSSSESDENRADISGTENSDNRTSTKLPCRINVVLRGAEWFVYNRGPAYDSVLAGLTKTSEADVPPDSSGIRRRKKGEEKNEIENGVVIEASNEKASPESIGDPLTSTLTGNAPPGHQPSTEDLENSLYLRLLPIYIDCSKAAMVIGNENTKSIIVAKSDRVFGEIDASSAGLLDQYRQLFNFNFENPMIKMHPNEDYKEDQAAAASHLKTGLTERNVNPPPSSLKAFLHKYRRRAWHQLQDLVPYFRSSVDSLSTNEASSASAANRREGAHWQGLSRYLDEEEQDDKARWSQIEYGAVPELVESTGATMSFYWDVPGVVPAHQGSMSDINGDEPPGYGVDLFVRGASLNYGPWADRQRADLQRVFFPYLCKDSIAAERLKPGQNRVMSIFKLYVQLDDEATLRVPIKEDSKNWKWKKHADTMWQETTARGRPGRFTRRKRRANKPLSETRAFGWLDIKVAANTTVTYVMDMVPGPHGFTNKLELDLPSAEISTSVNHGLLWRSVDARVSCDLSNPPKWNGLRTWRFKIVTTGLELFLLREHIFLLIDLIDDWSSGPPAEFLTFTPFKYLLDLRFEDFRLYLNTNDSNIINNPSDFDDNTFLIIFGSWLNAGVCIPIETFRPPTNIVSFDAEAEDGGINLHVPPWNTQASFLASTEVAKLQKLGVHGKYQYCATTSPANTDVLLLDVYGLAPSVEFYGFLIRYFMTFRNNYFGQDIHFRTLEEHQQVLALRQEDPEADISGGQPHKKSNDLDVILSISADDSTVILPSNLYKAESHIRVEVPSLGADLRFTNYYMDLDVFFSTLACSLVTKDDGITSSMSVASATQIFIDGLTIHGHRLFGLPPTEPTYVCNWDFAVGAITGECSTNFIRHLAAAGKGIGFSFDDDENALPSISEEILHDITFLRATVEPIRLWLHVDDHAMLLSTGALKLGFDDWAGSHYSKKLDLKIPDIVLACVDAESASRHRLRIDQAVRTHAYLQTSISLGIIIRKKGFTQDKELQQEHVRRHDQRTHRADFLLLESLDDLANDGPRDVVLPPAMAVPPLPWPIVNEMSDTSSASQKSSIRIPKQRLKRQSSFLSMSSMSTSSSRSVIRSRNGAHQTPKPSSHSTSRMSKDWQPRRDVSTASTGRQSSFYSLAGDHEERRNLAPSTTALASSYMAPYFPLFLVEPETDDAPDWDSTAKPDRPPSPYATLSDIDPNKFDEDEVDTGFIIEFDPGIRAFLDPEAAHAVANLLSGLREVDPTDILDALQTSSMSEIFDENKRKVVTRKRTDIHLRIPELHVRFINSSLKTPTTMQRNETDQYDLSVAHLAVSSRSSLIRQETERHPDGFAHASALHVYVDRINISAKERFHQLDDPQAAVNADVEELVFWIASGDTVSANANLRSIEVATSSSEVEYLASLLHRTSLLAQDLENAFSAVSEEQKRRLQLLVYMLATSPSTPDPLFLTRPSYVLRSAPDHLRLQDSWKIVSRLRHMYESLNPSAKQDIMMAVHGNNELCPPEAAQKVLDSFERWRGWDMNNIASSYAMQKVFGKHIQSNSSGSPTTKLTLKIRTVKLMIDPGPKQNEVFLVSLAVNVLRDEGDWYTQSPVIATKVQAYCVDAGISLNWELLELVNDVLKLSQTSELSRSQVSKPSPPSRSNMTTAEHQLQIVVATETGSITLDSINARSVSISKGLKTSFIMTEKEDNLHATFLLSAEAGTTKLRSRAEEILLSQLRAPSIYLAYEAQTTNEAINNTWRAAGYCQELSYNVQQDTIALLEIADRFIGDEVAQIYSLQQRMPKKTKSAAIVEPSPQSKDVVRSVNVALFLDKYQISMPLLQSLTYTVSGNVARGSIVSRLGTELNFDFDIKQHHHNVETRLQGNSESISVLDMPPTNGRVSYQTTSNEHFVSVFASTELIKFDARAIHSLTTALNRPEISSVFVEIKRGVRLIKVHLEEVFGPKDTKVLTLSSKNVDDKQFVYDANLTFEGLQVSADAPGSKKAQDKARLDFRLGSLQIKAANRLDPYGPVLQFPEIHVGLRHIMFELSRLYNGHMETCGNFAFAAFLTATSKKNERGDEVRSYHLTSDGLEINLFAETASTVVDVLGHFQETIKDVDLSRERQYLRKLSKKAPRITVSDENDRPASVKSDSTTFFASLYSLELLNIQVSWVVGTPELDRQQKEDLVLSIKRIDFSTRKENSAKLTIEDFQLQMVQPSQENKTRRSLNSALLPEVIFNVGYVSTSDARRLVFQAAGKSLDLRLTSHFIIPAAHLKASLLSASEKVRAATATWTKQAITSQTSQEPEQTQQTQRQPRKMFFGRKRMESLFVDADFAGATVYLSGKKINDPTSPRGTNLQSGRYAHFAQDDSRNTTELRSPGLAFKVEYQDDGQQDPSLNAEVKVDASNNMIYPTVVPLLLEISSSVKEIVEEDNKNVKASKPKASPQKLIGNDEDSFLTADPSAMLGRTRLNLGLRILKQEFTLSCQPIARVAATAKFNDIYFTVNTVRSTEHGHFFALSAAFNRLQASVQHVYSRESTGSFEVDSIVVSFMNSKHVSGVSGLSAILNVSPMRVLVNAKQLQDFLLFREIWLPPELRQSTPVPAEENPASQVYLVQRYQQVAATGAFPWNATISIAELNVQLDLGQSIGKSEFIISNFWVSSKKNSDWEQNLCLSFDRVGVESMGRMSGSVQLQDFKVRTSIEWLSKEKAVTHTPLIQASLGFSQLRVKASFDYQPFLVADITSFGFMMYNVHGSPGAHRDRLVAVLDGEAVQVFCTTTTAAQGLALYQAIQKLIQEKKANFETSLREIEKFIRRKADKQSFQQSLLTPTAPPEEEKPPKSPVSLFTRVVVTLKALNIGCFPNTFYDHQVFKMEASDAQARFSVAFDDEKIHSSLGLTLGQLRIALSGVREPNIPKVSGEISVDEVVESATGSRGGTILKVPRLEAIMQTWQTPESNHIDYIFKSFFEGKVEVGWNYSRISYIRNMWATHSKSLALRLGKPLPLSAVKITGVPGEEDDKEDEGQGEGEGKDREQQKITAEVNVPQSKYDYTALEPPIIETPQLRDMGEATPPLEWIGLHRDRLPNLTHQIVIVSLLEVASEVEDAYEKILGTS